MGKIGIVHGVLAVGAHVEEFVAPDAEFHLEHFLQLKSAMIRADGDHLAHRGFGDFGWSGRGDGNGNGCGLRGRGSRLQHLPDHTLYDLMKFCVVDLILGIFARRVIIVLFRQCVKLWHATGETLKRFPKSGVFLEMNLLAFFQHGDELLNAFCARLGLFGGLDPKQK